MFLGSKFLVIDIDLTITCISIHKSICSIFYPLGNLKSEVSIYYSLTLILGAKDLKLASIYINNDPILCHFSKEQMEHNMVEGNFTTNTFLKLFFEN